MGKWVKICTRSAAPAAGQVTEVEANGFLLCLANIGGELSALDNWCPHGQGPLGQGYIKGQSVVCPWHNWAFDTRTGLAEYPEGERVDVVPVRVEGDDVLVEIPE